MLRPETQNAVTVEGKEITIGARHGIRIRPVVVGVRVGLVNVQVDDCVGVGIQRRVAYPERDDRRIYVLPDPQ